MLGSFCAFSCSLPPLAPRYPHPAEEAGFVLRVFACAESDSWVRSSRFEFAGSGGWVRSACSGIVGARGWVRSSRLVIAAPGGWVHSSSLAGATRRLGSFRAIRDGRKPEAGFVRRVSCSSSSEAGFVRRVSRSTGPELGFVSRDSSPSCSVSHRTSASLFARLRTPNATGSTGHPYYRNFRRLRDARLGKILRRDQPPTTPIDDRSRSAGCRRSNRRGCLR